MADRVSDYHGLGTMLKLTSVQLSNIEEENRKVVRRCMEVLNTWISEKTRKPTTWWTLITALREMKLIKLARKIDREISSS